MDRRFQIYGVGMNRTGTATLAAIFARYRSAHQFMRDESDRAVSDRAAGRLTTAGLRDFLLARDEEWELELDSSANNGLCADVLADAFPKAKFILTIRNFYSWFGSEQNKLLLRTQNRALYPKASPAATATRQELELGGHYRSEEAFLASLPTVLPVHVAEWSRANQFVLDHVPAERLLVVRTLHFATSLKSIADFAGVPSDTLVAGVHEHKAPHDLRILAKADPALLEREVRAGAGALMDRFFPGYTMKDYLAGRAALGPGGGQYPSRP